ncbi:MAG TPA: hypothetical protein VGI74_20100 [Streptosporangiaceae bacterium]|jgi:hypothetical protein
MRKPGSLAAVLAAALTIGLGATPAVATTTWTIEPGGAFTSGPTTFAIGDSVSHTTITCTSVTLNGTLESGSGVLGPGAGTITSVSLGTCTAQNGQPFNLEATGLPWSINLAPNPIGNNNNPTGTITGIQVSSLGPVCKAVIHGNDGVASGLAPFGFSNRLDTLSIASGGGNLRVFGLSSCTGYFVQGDPVSTSANFVLLPPQTITTSS